MCISSHVLPAMISSCTPTRHDELGDQHLHDLAVLSERFAADSCYAAVWVRAGRPQLQDFALDMQGRAGPRRRWPAEFSAGPDNPTPNRHAFYYQPHRNGRRVPDARRQPLEQRSLGSLGVEMKRLGVELPRECFDLLFVDPVRAAEKALSDAEI